MAKRRQKRSYTYVRGATRPVIRFRFKVVVVIFLIITAACFAIYMTGVNFGGEEEGSYTATWLEDTTEAVSGDSGTEGDGQAGIAETVNIENPVPESEPMSQTYFGKCMFVGDSITVGLSDYQLVPMKNVLAEIGMNIEKINTETMQTAYGNTTVLDALTQSAPENVYIMLGSNGIAWLSIDDMIAEYSEFTESVRKALPDSRIYIQSIPPVTAAREKAENPISNADINEYNSRLLELANEKGYYYIDVHSALAGPDGALPVEDAADDGMHFNKTTYDVMLKYILSHVAK